MLYFFNYKRGTVEPELKMNRNTADLYRMPLEGGGGTVYPIPIAWPIDACRFAGGGDAALVSSLTLDRYEGAGARGGRRDSIFFEPGGAGHFPDFELKST